MPLILPFDGKSPKIASDAFIAENAVIIGDVEISSGASIWYNCVLRGDIEAIRVGENSNLQDGTIVHVNRENGPTIIGNNVTIGHLALLHACIIEDYAFIGMGAQVIDYAKVESFAMVAAGSLVTPNKIVPSGDLWAGSPAKMMRKLGAEDMEKIKQSAINYCELAKQYMTIGP